MRTRGMNCLLFVLRVSPISQTGPNVSILRRLTFGSCVLRHWVETSERIRSEMDYVNRITSRLPFRDLRTRNASNNNKFHRGNFYEGCFLCLPLVWGSPVWIFSCRRECTSWVVTMELRETHNPKGSLHGFGTMSRNPKKRGTIQVGLLPRTEVGRDFVYRTVSRPRNTIHLFTFPLNLLCPRVQGKIGDSQTSGTSVTRRRRVGK